MTVDASVGQHVSRYRPEGLPNTGLVEISFLRILVVLVLTERSHMLDIEKFKVGAILAGIDRQITHYGGCIKHCCENLSYNSITLEDEAKEFCKIEEWKNDIISLCNLRRGINKAST